MPEDKSGPRGSVAGNYEFEALGFAEDAETAESSMLHDIDAILSRLGNGIARERKAMDELLARIRQRAA